MCMQKQVPKTADARGHGNGLQLLKGVTSGLPMHNLPKEFSLTSDCQIFILHPIHTKYLQKEMSASAYIGCTFDCELLASSWSSRKRPCSEATPKPLLNVVYPDFAQWREFQQQFKYKVNLLAEKSQRNKE